MMAETSAPEHKLQEVFDSLTGNHSKASLQARKNAFEYLQENGLPNSRDEEYKYTPLTKLIEKQFDLEEGLGHATPSDLDPTPHFIPDAVGDRVVFINGQYASQYSQLSNGLEITILSEGGNLTDLLSEHYGTHPFITQDSWAALNASFSQDGLIIKAGTDRKAGTPLYIYHIADSSQKQSVAQVHSLVVAEPSANISLVEVFHSQGNNPSFVNTATEIILKKNSRVEHYKVGLENENTIHAGHTMVHQSRDSHYHDVTINLTGGTVRNNLNIVLDAENCEAHMIGLYLPTGKQHVDNHTVVDHKKPHSFSNELYKGVMADRSNAVFNGKIFVRQDAQKTNAFQSNKNLLLSNDATINTKPQLEIWADDVKCSHGATTGQLDEEQVFYLMSRGLGAEQARAMLLGAFASEVTEQINIEPLRKYIDSIVGERLNA
ncbi:Fe-S cluster assembly protein SufD [Roseivirga sp. BDSF3-8]|uniref:Fe-S cluster assembly protein SufD n=1 Tax=Roseivirga sp. BDSF3-8 TaxID=3241598 RepID=UPI003531E28A